MFKPTEAQLRLLDTCVRLSLNEDGLLAIVLQMKDDAVTQAIGASGEAATKALGHAQAWENFHKLLLSVPANLNRIDEARRTAPKR